MDHRDHEDAASVAWIAGVGASDGLGAALARRFAQERLQVAITGRNARRIALVVDEIRSVGGIAHAVPADLSNEGQVEAAARLVAGVGPLHAAVFNASAGARGTVAEITAGQFEEAWRTTVLGGFLFARAALRGLLANGASADTPQGRGSLLLTGATASLRGRPPFAAFAAAKAGLRSLGQSLAREYGPQGIHVAHVVVDGGIDGERLRTHSPQRAADAGPDGLLAPHAIADTYWQLHRQHRSAWTQELDLRPWRESF